jgi:hypothetical protein
MRIGEMPIDLVETQESDVNEQIKNREEQKQVEKPDGRLRGFLEDENDESQDAFRGVELESKSMGKLKIEKGDSQKQKLKDFFQQNAKKLMEGEFESDSVEEWAENKAEELLRDSQRIENDLVEGDEDIELDLSDTKKIQIKDGDGNEVKSIVKDNRIEENNREEYEQLVESKAEATTETSQKSDKKKQGSDTKNIQEQSTIELSHAQDEQTYNKKMLQFKMKDSTFLSADTKFMDLKQSQEGSDFNNALKQLGSEIPQDDANVSDYLVSSIEEGKMSWDDVDTLLNKKEK